MSIAAVMRIYAEINIFCIALLALIQVRLYLSINLSPTQRYMRNSIWSMILLFVWECVWAVMYNNSIPDPSAFENFFRSVYFIILIWSAYLWYRFDARLFSCRNISENAIDGDESDKEEQDCGEALEKKREYDRRMHRLLMLPAGVITVVNVLNIVAGHMFADDIYTERVFRPWTFAGFLVPFIYIAAAAAGTHRKYSRSGRTDALVDPKVFQVGVALSMVAAVLQGLYNLFPILSAMVTLSYLTCYVTMQDGSISVDALTHLNNRRQFSRYLKMKMHDRKPSDKRLFLMIMDVDYFKQINDTYGHVEGDAALVRMADAMRKCGEKFGRGMQISRFGGDEFIIVLETRHPEDIERIETDIQSTLREKTKEAGVPYEMNVSIGVAEYSPAMKDISAFLAAADAELYKVKMEHHSRRSAS